MFIAQPVCLIMEFVPGGSLTKLLEQMKLSEKLKGNILLDIAKGLLFLHNNNIYHRDLKPDNVLVRHIPSAEFLIMFRSWHHLKEPIKMSNLPIL